MSSSEPATSASTFTLELHTATKEEHNIYVVGNFNQWRVADAAYRMEPTRPGAYQLILRLEDLPEILEYKYARGNWDHVELGNDGNDRPNRRVQCSQGRAVDRVERWKQDSFSYPNHYLPIIDVIGDDIALPETIRTRRIAALLPYNYHDSDRQYPVLYLQDGQNLFDDYAPYGNWAVDKRLAQLQSQGLGDVIIVAIDHAMDKRIVEFTPTTATTQFGKGQGRSYVRFMVDVLKPYIDQKYRTLTGGEHTGIGGSSMGGLISIYAGMMYPEVFQRLMIFSPSLWVTPNIPFQLLNFARPYTGRVYLYGGRKESATMVPNLERLKRAIERKAKHHQAEFNLSVDPDGEHNEARWGQEFPAALTWLFYPNSTAQH
ncbi:MAG: alpha/beta hydrolase-fold protein [Bacteroidota bacterium]